LTNSIFLYYYSTNKNTISQEKYTTNILELILGVNQTMMEQEKDMKVDRAASRMKAKRRLLQDFMKVEIYNAAVNAVEKHGWSTISMDEIAREIGGSKGTIYYYFKSKNDLMIGMWLHIFNEISSVLVQIYKDATLDPDTKLKKYIWNYALYLCRWWRFSKVIWSNALFITRWDEETDKTLLNARKKAIGNCIKLVAALHPGRPSNKERAEHEGLALVNFMESLVVWYYEPYPLSSEQVADLIADSLMNGLRHG
jgi:TetR/AcrR family transcriptional regulator, cholesterol catabolism regulator